MVKAAFILAKDEEGMQPVFGVPAVRRLIVIIRRIGILNVHLLTADQSLARALFDLLPQDALHIVRDRTELNEIIGKLDINQADRMLITRAEHVIDQKSLSVFLKEVEKAESGYADNNDAGSPKSGSKYALNSDGAPVSDAMYVVGSDALHEVVQVLWSPADSDLSVLTGADLIKTNSGLPCALKGEGAIETAENRLTAILSSATEHRDGFMARHADRHLSCLISRRLARTAVTPNVITLTNVAIGLAGALLLWTGGYRAQLCGTLLFLLCVVMDGVDGEVARLKLQETVFGHYLDIVTDNIVHGAIFIGLAGGLYHRTGNRLYLALLWVLLGGFLLCAASVYRVSKPHAEGPISKTVQKLTGLLANRDFAYLLVALAIIDRLNWFLVATSVGSYVFAVVLLGLDLVARRSPVGR